MLVLLVLIICLALSIFGVIIKNGKHPYDAPVLLMLSTGILQLPRIHGKAGFSACIFYRTFS